MSGFYHSDAGYYDDDYDDYSEDSNQLDLNTMIREFDMDEFMDEEGLIEQEMAEGAGSALAMEEYDASPLAREFHVAEDLAAKLALESDEVALEDVGEAIDLDDAIQGQIYELLKAEALVDNVTVFDHVHEAIVQKVAKRAYDSAMYEAGGMLPDTGDEWADMVQQIKENQAIEKAEYIASVLTHDIRKVTSLINDFAAAADKVSWSAAAQIRATMDYLHLRELNDLEAMGEVYKVLAMLGDLDEQITQNELALFEDREALALRMKKDDEKALQDVYRVLEEHASLVKAVFTEKLAD